MNTFGRNFRITNYGESHGEGIGVVIDGCPVGVKLEVADFLEDLGRRRAGKPGTTPRIEKDLPVILSGVFNGYTTGAPINIFFKNENINSKSYEGFRTQPRPGHSDYAANEKYGGYNDVRGGGRFSGRVTLSLVAAGVVAKKILEKSGKDIKIESKILSLGEIDIIERSPKEIEEYLEKIREMKDSVGGVIECKGKNIPNSLGEPFFDSVESLISHVVFSIGGVRGIEFGSGFESSKLKGSVCNDPILNKEGKTLTNNCGGINGGITNGNDIIFKVAIKPTPSIGKEQETFSFKEDKISKFTIKGRHDTAFVLRVPVVVEASLAIVLAELFLRNKLVNI